MSFSRPTPIVLIVVVLLVSLGLQGLASPPPPAAAPGPVAVVDLFRILEKAKPFDEDREEIRRWIDDQKRTNLTVKKDAISTKEAELELFDAGSAEGRKLRNQIDFAKLAFQQEFEYLEELRRARIQSAQKDAYRRAREVIQQVAKSRGVSVVLQLRPHELSGRDEAELSAEMFVRDVLWHDGSLDITGDVIRILDASR